MQVARGAPHVHMRKKICHHPLKLHLQKYPLRGVLWKRCSVFPGLHFVGISWSVLEEKFILTGGCFSLPAHQGWKEVRSPRNSGVLVQEIISECTLLTIFNYSIKHLSLMDRCKKLSVGSLRIKNHHHFPRKLANTTKEHLSILENM